MFDAGLSLGAGDWPFLLAFLLAAGLAAGFIAGLLGVGGGIVVVPATYYLFTLFDVDAGVRMHLAVGTSLAVIIPTGLRSVLAHRARDAVDVDLLKRWGPALLVGVGAGTLLAAVMSTAGLTLLFALVTLFNASLMAFGGGALRLGAALPRARASLALPAAIGGISAMTGLGGGALIVPALTLYDTPIHRAVGTAAGFGLMIGAAGTIGFVVSGLGAAGLPPFPWALGYVSLPGFLIIIVGSIAAAPAGAWVAHRMSRTVLRRTFAGFLVIVAAKLLLDLAGV